MLREPPIDQPGKKNGSIVQPVELIGSNLTS